MLVRVHRLKDRWQAASDMKGTPIRGPHWLEVDLGRPCRVTRFLLDWETAFASDYTVLGLAAATAAAPGLEDAATPVVLADGAAVSSVTRAKQHVTHDLPAAAAASSAAPPPPWVQKVRLEIRKPATQWGVSLWQFQVFGVCRDTTTGGQR